MGKLGKFLTAKAGSLVSKKLAGAIGAETIVQGTELAGTPLLVFIVVQGVVDVVERIIAYLERRNSDTA
jgi:hypothetical protein